MMYVLAAWTGFRKGEIGSLRLKSLRLDDDPPTATVEACFSKRKRQDTQVLHPELAGLLSEWLATKTDCRRDEPLFPVYTHVGVHDQTAAIRSLPAPPGYQRTEKASASLAKTGTDGPRHSPKKVPTVVPRGARNGAIRLASQAYQAASICTESGDEEAGDDEEATGPNVKRRGTLRTALHSAGSPCIDLHRAKSEVSPAGFEPATFGSGGTK
jgi:integrase